MVRPERFSLEELAPYLHEAKEPYTLLNLAALFGNGRPVEVEVGFGKGLFLLRSALARPEVNFLGIEIVRKYQLFTATRMAKRQLHNVRLVKADARAFLRDALAPGCLSAVHVYYPDPWWKKRHHKRRVFTPEFAAECQRVLRPGGHLHLVTDVPEYFAVMQELVAKLPGLEMLPPPPEREPEDDLDYLTNFERKFRKQGKPVHRAVYVRRGADSV